MINSIKLFILIIFSPLAVLSQVSELNFSEINNCVPLKNKDVINNIEQSYKDGVVLYNDAKNNNLIEQSSIEKLVSLFKIQVLAKDMLQEIWQQFDSTAKENSKKYFTEATVAFKGLTDTININNPEFKSINRSFLIVEKAHQVILLQKFGIQVLFGCVREGSSGLSQPLNSSNELVINIDMVERFRKVWNEANSPMTYDKWVYIPTERRSFVNKSYADLWKEFQVGTKKDTLSPDSSKPDLITQNAIANNSNTSGLDTSKQNLITQNVIANNTITSKKDNKKAGKDKSTVSTKGDNITSNNGQRFAGNNRTTTIIKGDSLKANKGQKGTNRDNQQVNNFSIKGEGKRIGINQNTQYEIKNLITKSKINTLGVDFFTIQIAASRNKLVAESLKKDFYCGNLEIEEKNESGWYKYLIGHFTSIDSANKYLEKTCLVRGFVSGYNSKGRVAIFSIKQAIKGYESSSTFSIVYRIQVAASKQPLTSEVLSMIYKGINPINVSQEDGWFRYSIGDFLYYDEAKVARDSCGIKAAFVMPYQNGKRIQWPGKAALELLKVNQKENSIYVVQVAASRNPLSLETVKNIIKIDYPLTMTLEDGWYKYYISAFTDFAYAKQVAEKIGIKGAFIATYKNGLRVVNP